MYERIPREEVDYKIELDNNSIVLSCIACPVIYDFKDVEGTQYHFRLRHGAARVVCEDTNEILVAGTVHGHDGYCTWNEAAQWMRRQGLDLV